MDSMKKRYFYKLSTNVITLILSFATAGIVPRALGPNDYGNFNFLANFFGQIANFLDMGTSTCFYTRLSKDNKNIKLITIYFGYFLILFSIASLLVVFLSYTKCGEFIWPQQMPWHIQLAFVYAMLMFFSTIFDKILDALGYTVFSESVRLGIRFLSVAVLVYMFTLGFLNISKLFYYHIAVTAITIFCFGLCLWKKKIRISFDISANDFKSTALDFYKYSGPLFVVILIDSLISLGERRLLQGFSGSSEQAYYGIAYVVNSFCSIFSSSMTPLFLREYSIAYGENNLDMMKRLLVRYQMLLYSVASYFACFIFSQVDFVVNVIAGSEYVGAIPAISVMALFPLHQTYGQIHSSILYATDRTKTYRNITIIMSVIGIVASFFLLAPQRYGGWDLGAFGLAFKALVMNVFIVNLFCYMNMKKLELCYTKALLHQIGIVSLFLLLAFASKLLVAEFSFFYQNQIVIFVVSGVLYTIFCLFHLLLFPKIFGLSQGEVKQMMIQVVQHLKSIK
ncbi:MAG: lipopolysaccharide biosynthesis protein [Oligoflexia bacterium]|nr:lipopolysaccharide biosynthesis protein [Oligoflexia bacterium]